jgi:FkbM family methyltransferase
MYDQFRWTNASVRRNGLTMEYEPLQPFFLIALAEQASCGTVIDVGANIGSYSLFATLIPTVERVVAFEANPDTVKELKANIALNRLGHKIEVQARAVSSAPGEQTFGVVSRFSGANSIVGTSIHDRSTFHKQIAVEAITLDQLFARAAARPLCIKIDVEGHESEVIDGARATLEANRCVIQLEGYGRADSSNLRKLEELGYFRLTAIGPDHYLSNLERLRNPAEVVGLYERTAERMIAYNHRNKTVTLKRGDFALEISGKSADVARRLAKRLIGKHL